ncbi:EAL domain-containing protein [Phytohabitans aurantiacus]|jgi:EAL domain-containing protein (putative c-di-GMP-specific phosphodiesterase class I)/GGDEF domain-containing protein/PAS domain-containing protein|nr:EAL domain-containing protein [Phytohabitans aurantiacus]
MDLDDILALAADPTPTSFESARARRAADQVLRRYADATAAGLDVVGDVDPSDPLTTVADEVTRIVRAAQLAKLGSVTWLADTGELTWSDEMSLILGRPPGAVRPSIDALFAAVHPADAIQAHRDAVRAWVRGSVTETTCRVIRHDGTTRYVHALIELVAGEGHRPYGIVATVEDVTELELARQERDRLARRRQTVRAEPPHADPVTGLLTRVRFTDEVERALRAGTGALLVVATEMVGPAEAGGSSPEAGLSAAVAAFVMQVAKRGDLCGVVGYGELGVLMHDTPLRAATARARAIVEALRGQSFVAGRHRLRVNAWGGLVRYRANDGASSFDLIIDAESAWRRAKETGESLHAWSQPAPADERAETCRTRVRAAVAGNGFTLYTQPILDLRLNQITRQEILLRPLNDAGEPVSPSPFLDIAERVDEMPVIDRWVLDRTLELIAQGPPTSHYQVNLNARSLDDPDLLGHVCDLIDQYGVDPRQITFEITETAIIGSRMQALTFANGVRELGCQLALDDFGTGYSSFSYLRSFPIDLVKIDGEFIVDLRNSPAAQAMVVSLVQMCRALGILTAAEYVKDGATIDLLRGYGVDFVQGEAVGMPRPIAGAPRSAEQSIVLELAVRGL